MNDRVLNNFWVNQRILSGPGPGSQLRQCIALANLCISPCNQLQDHDVHHTGLTAGASRHPVHTRERAKV